MGELHEARFYEPQPHARVLCTLCPHDCHIAEGGRGACGVRYNHAGKLYTLVYDKIVAREVNPIEKKPLFHFQPGSYAYSVSTVGCSLRCLFCQNWQISQWPKEGLPKHLDAEERADDETICPQLAQLGAVIPGEPVTPRAIVDAALKTGCQSISYTFTEPTIFFELAFDTAVLARERGLKNNFVSNGFINAAPLRDLATVLDGVNVDLKFFTEESYRRLSRARLAPVLDAIRLYHELGVWVEVTTLIIPGLNDSDKELSDIADFICSVGPEIPWHVTQYYPAYKMHDRLPTPVATLRRARQIGSDAGLRYVYEGNVPGEGGENTYCYACGSLLIERYGFHVRLNRIRADRCPDCGALIDGIGMSWRS
ncbi:MAG: radical SAM protein [Thiotrichales bacterium SG8_50]|nr:MAG: radical SAM protein [Thiotrichales bacterium SG8_50]